LCPFFIKRKSNKVHKPYTNKAQASSLTPTRKTYFYWNAEKTDYIWP
jgi:hypothetical protein